MAERKRKPPALTLGASTPPSQAKDSPDGTIAVDTTNFKYECSTLSLYMRKTLSLSTSDSHPPKLLAVLLLYGYTIIFTDVAILWHASSKLESYD